ncbi:MAG: heme ABC transporter ATP-binding protein [Chloroflexi bacterium]|nr:heme ABC transporter ATP-binding protein [Chloroflexota bacterium]
MATIDVQGVTLAYDDTEILHEIELEAHPGEVLALVGPNGVGKTTLLRALSRQLRPQQGVILVDGRDTWRLSHREAARQVGLVPQQADGDWPLSVEEVVALGRMPHRGWFLPLSSHDRQVIRKTLQQIDLYPLRHRQVATLSGGERQRVLIARALVQEPQVLLLDEPTANLDLRYQGMALTLVQQLAHEQGLIVIVSIHDLNLAALYADRVALLAEGRLLAKGTPHTVLTAELLSLAYGIPVVVSHHPVYNTPLVAPVLPHKKNGVTK